MLTPSPPPPQAETALERLDLGVAEKAYVACSDYPGIQFVKRLRLLGDKFKQKAEVAASLARFDEAVSIYRTADRADLAVELRMRVGDWKHVLHLLQNGGGGGDDELVKLAQNRLGDYYADRQQWAAALPLYEAANNYEALVECCYIVEDYTALAALIEVRLPRCSSTRTTHIPSTLDAPSSFSHRSCPRARPSSAASAQSSSLSASRSQLRAHYSRRVTLKPLLMRVCC